MDPVSWSDFQTLLSQRGVKINLQRLQTCLRWVIHHTEQYGSFVFLLRDVMPLRPLKFQSAPEQKQSQTEKKDKFHIITRLSFSGQLYALSAGGKAVVEAQLKAPSRITIK